MVQEVSKVLITGMDLRSTTKSTRDTNQLVVTPLKKGADPIKLVTNQNDTPHKLMLNTHPKISIKRRSTGEIKHLLTHQKLITENWQLIAPSSYSERAEDYRLETVCFV